METESILPLFLRSAIMSLDLYREINAQPQSDKRTVSIGLEKRLHISQSLLFLLSEKSIFPRLPDVSNEILYLMRQRYKPHSAGKFHMDSFIVSLNNRYPIIPFQDIHKFFESLHEHITDTNAFPEHQNSIRQILLLAEYYSFN